jgi:hypothetical protein
MAFLHLFFIFFSNSFLFSSFFLSSLFSLLSLSPFLSIHDKWILNLTPHKIIPLYTPQLRLDGIPQIPLISLQISLTILSLLLLLIFVLFTQLSLILLQDINLFLWYYQIAINFSSHSPITKISLMDHTSIHKSSIFTTSHNQYLINSQNQLINSF